MKKLIAAAMVAVACLAAVTVSADVIKTDDPNVTLEVPDKDWKKIEKDNSLIALQKDGDLVMVVVFDKVVKEDGIQFKMEITDDKGKKKDYVMDAAKFAESCLMSSSQEAAKKFEESYQTFYNTEDKVYVITGFAEKKETIGEVRSIVESFILVDHKEAEEKAAKKKEESRSSTEEVQVPEPTGTYIYLYREDGSYVTVLQYTDSTWKDDNKTGYVNRGNGVWVDTNGRSFYEWNPAAATDTVQVAEPTGTYIVLYNSNGEYVKVLLFTDDTWQSEDMVGFFDLGEGFWQDTFGNSYYEWDPTYVEDDQFDIQVAEPTGEDILLYSETGMSVVVMKFTDGTWMNNDMTGFYNYGNGTWADTFGNTYYEWDPTA